MADRGPQFDEFHQTPGSPHGGAWFDEGFKPASEPSAHGRLFDQFPRNPGTSAHGNLYDGFEWHEMPDPHGRLFDRGFAEARAHGGPHATWFDAFQGGALVRYTRQGAEYEGVVIQAARDHATAVTREGARHELDYDQVLAYAPANAGQPSRTAPRTAHPGQTDTSLVAHRQAGDPNGGGQRSPVHPEATRFANKSTPPEDDLAKRRSDHGPRGRVGAPVPRPQGTVQERRAGRIAAASNKLPDVRHGGFACTGCGHMDYREHRVVAKGGELHPHLAMRGCVHCGLLHPHHLGKTSEEGLDVAKDLDASEGAVQAQDLEGEANARWCPHCKHICRKVENGHCPTCGGPVTVRKTLAETLDTLKALA